MPPNRNPCCLENVLVIKPLKPSRRRYFASLEQMERREVLSSARVEMTPGSESQTILPFEDKFFAIIHSTDTSVVRDINNQIIDFNKDGLPDLLNMSENWILGGSALAAGHDTNPLLAEASGKFRLTKVDGHPYANGFSVAVLDWNGDGNQDYLAIKGAALGEKSIEYWIYQNDGHGVFSTAIFARIDLKNNSQYTTYGQILCMADFNSDGAPDLVVPNTPSYTIFNGILENGKWNGLFDDANTQTLTMDLGNNSSNVNPQAADLNGDGKMDIVAPGPQGPRVFMNNGSGQFLTTGTFDLTGVDGKKCHNVVVADFNGDGKPDIAGSNGFVTEALIGKVSIFLNSTPSPTSGNATFDAASGGGSSEVSYGQLVVGDMNLDGSTDIVAAGASEYGNVYYILTNSGSGQFPGQRIFNAFQKIQCHVGGIGVADWNSDGQLDVSVGIAWIARDVPPSSNYAVAGGIGLSFNSTFQPLGLNTGKIPPASPGVPYSYQLRFTGGNSSLPYHVSLNPDGSNLPAGLTLSLTGLISGTPTQSGTFQPLFNITQPDGQRGTALDYLTVAAEQQISISPGALPNAVAGIPYRQPFTTNNGPAIWGISQGALPTGMTLSQTGVLSGTPTVLGQYNFQITATGAVYQTSVSYALNVQSVAAPIVTKLVRFGYHAQPTTLVASFSQTLDASAASNVGNYVLTSAGADGRFGTRDDKNIKLASAIYNAGANTVTLGLVQKNIPLRQLYRLAITGTPTSGLQNTGGVFLGGQGIGAPGTNYVQIFSGKILAGPNLLLKSSKGKSAK